MTTAPQSDTVVEVSIRMSLLVDDLVHATHEQAPIGEFYKAKDTLLREIARLEKDLVQALRDVGNMARQKKILLDDAMVMAERIATLEDRPRRKPNA